MIREKQCNGVEMKPGLLVSFVPEETDKGPAAKDLREEDPARVVRVLAKVQYGTVEVLAFLSRLLRCPSPPPSFQKLH